MTKTWWKKSIIYQVYPRSFNDSNGDGIGDIRGVIERLEYIKKLGVTVIWLCPVYKSPNDDNGYDISDYYQIMQEFGSMEDFDELLAKVHHLGMKLIMDLVVNHTSDEHHWFLESRSSKENPKRDYYIWKDPSEDKEPNNWLSFFGGKAWELDEVTGQYYLHLFTRKQPDLNWENPKVREEVYEMMHFWLKKGIDGFRMDVISLISKRGFENAPEQNFTETIENIYANGPEIHNYLNEMNESVTSKYDIFTVGEGPGISLKHGLKYVQESRKELDMIFHFDHMFIDHGSEGKFDPIPIDLVHFKKVFKEWDELLAEGGWSSIFLGNHDFPRIVSRFADDSLYHQESAKALSVLLMTHRGTPYIYQGDEIGMTNVSFESIDDYRDVETLNAYKEAMENGRDLDDFMSAVHRQGRDNARTPVQWNSSENAGFSEVEPWIKVNPNYKEINVERQDNDPSSILNFYRQMVELRKSSQTLTYGEYEVVDIENTEVYAYLRTDDEYKYFIVINFTNNKVKFSFDELSWVSRESIELNNYSSLPTIGDGYLLLEPRQSLIFKK